MTARSPACSPRRSLPRIRRLGCHVLAGGPDNRPVGSGVRRVQVPVEPHGRGAAVDRRAAHIAARVCGRRADVAPSAPLLRCAGARADRGLGAREHAGVRLPLRRAAELYVIPSGTQFLDFVVIGLVLG